VTQHSPASEAENPADALAADLALALRLADAADAQSLPRFQADDLGITTKADSSRVTDADLAVERAIRDLLAAERPEDGIFGEEFGSAAGTGAGENRQWIIDPIDGTHGFLRGTPLWGTMIALAIDGVPAVGVVSAPAIDGRWWASTGGGAWARNADGSARRLAVSSVDRLEDATISFQSITQWDGAGQLPALIALTRRVWRDRAFGDVWPYMLIAEGQLEMVAEFGVAEYDIAAAVPIVREAGGAFTAYDGVDTLSGRSSLATNGTLHQDFLDFLQQDHPDTLR
jgi:histidinol-phosphatase